MIRISILLQIWAACFATLNMGYRKKLCIEKEKLLKNARKRVFIRINEGLCV
jgi:hypothetical protein